MLLAGSFVSGRSGYRKSHHPLLGRIGAPRRRRPRSDSPQQWRLSFFAPETLLLAPGDTGVVGVRVDALGPRVITEGGNRDWVLQQAATFLGNVAGGIEFKCEAILERLDTGAPPRAKWCREMVYVPDASVVFLHPLKGALIFPVKAA